MLEIPGSGGIGYLLQYSWASLVTQMIQNLSAMWGELGSVPGLGRSLGGGHGNSLQYSRLENLQGQWSLVGHSAWGHQESEHEGGRGTEVRG